MDCFQSASSKCYLNTDKSEEKLKILCLHGYRQNAESFKTKLGAFRKIAKKFADFTFVTAPHQAPPLDHTSEESHISDQKSWWFNKDDGTFKGTNFGGPAIGFQKSVKVVENIWEQEGPFDGLLGFSQGACFVSLLCGMSAKRFTLVRPKFAILSSGFKSGSLVHENFYENVITLPTVHIFGESDDIICADLSRSLASGFKNPTMLTHPGGHYFPATTSQKATYVGFFERYLYKLDEETTDSAIIEEFALGSDSDEI